MQKRLRWIVVVAVLAVGAILLRTRLRPGSDQFDRLMTRGAGYLEKGDATNAVATCFRAVNLVPENLGARLNLANAYLLADDDQKAVQQCQEALNLEGARQWRCLLSHRPGPPSLEPGGASRPGFSTISKN